jgi:hypothetical protein
MTNVIPASLSHLLHELGGSGRTGALHIDGPPDGVLYLVDGHLTHAESTACPGVGERLVASGRLSASTWKAAYESGKDQHRVGRNLIRDGHLGQHELASRVIATICDATHALLQQSADAPVRFVPGERHWLGVITKVELGTLIHETAKRLRTVPPVLPWAGTPHPGWPRRDTRNRPDYAALKRIRRRVQRAM